MKKRLRSNRRIKLSIKVRNFIRSIMQWFLLVLIAIIVGYSVIVLFFQTVNVVGPSMSPTLKDGQVVFVNKIDYKIHGIDRFDIIAFSRVADNEYYDIKRVIGLPGETIKITDGDVYVNNEKLTNMPFNDKILLSGAAANEIQLGNNEYFVLGDNVNNSEDSRYTNVGLINKSEIIGVVKKIIEPKSEKGKVK